jgi:GT2 family glycosyltransferase
METSICIVTFNACKRLGECLRSLAQYPPGGEYEIIVVDNASSDDTLAMLENEFPQVRVIQNTRNEGYTRPLNQALKAASGAFLMPLNPDTLLTEDLFSPLLAFMAMRPQAGIITPKVLNQDCTLQMQCRRGEARPLEVFGYFLHLDRLFPKNKKLGGYLMRWLPENEIAEVPAVSGSCMLIRRAVIEQVGFFDEDYYAYQEDADLCFRARRAGWKVYYVPTSAVVHFGGEGGSAVRPYQGVYQWHRSYYLYYRKHLARDYCFLFNWLYYAFMAIKLAWALLVTFFRKKKVVGTPKK